MGGLVPGSGGGRSALGACMWVQRGHELAASPSLLTRLSFPICNMEMVSSMQHLSNIELLWNSK